MNSTPAYVVITPARDEEEHIRRTLDSLTRQTVLPRQWVVVDDGSTDRTGAILDAHAAVCPWLRSLHRPNRGQRQPGKGVMDTFYAGYDALSCADWEFIVKLDADLSFAPDYFERCFAYFRFYPGLGIAGGAVDSMRGDTCVPDSPSDPAFHVRGATKIYRRACWDAIQPLVRAPGWDTMDELKANMLGWRTGTLHELRIVQHRATGAAAGRWPNSVKNGRANYVVGYHPLFMFLKCLKRLPRRPILIDATGLFWGYASGCLRRAPRVEDPELVRYVRRQQIRGLLFRDGLWSQSRIAPPAR
jgi:glycosyltransferase involved in cell wall biosynthesis